MHWKLRDQKLKTILYIYTSLYQNHMRNYKPKIHSRYTERRSNPHTTLTTDKDHKRIKM